MAAQLSTIQFPGSGASNAVSPPLSGPGGDEAHRYYAEIEALERALQTNPGDVDAILRLGRYCAETSRCVEASALFTQALQVNATHAATFVAMADLLKQQGMYADAVDLLQNAIERNAGEPELWRAMANTMVAMADEDRAEIFFDEALRLSPNLTACRLERAGLHARAGRADAAIADYDFLLACNADDARALVGRADVHLATGRREAARAAYLRSLTLVRDKQSIVDRLERAAIMEIQIDLHRSPMADSPPRDPTAPHGPLHVVFFHADVNSTGNTEMMTADYHRLIANAAAVARHKTNARIVLLTDQRTPVDSSLGVDQVVRDDVELQHLMFERMRRQRAYLSGVAGANILFLDVDTLINRNPLAVFDGTFDVGLVYRHDIPEAPFNGGIIFARAGDRAMRFFDIALDCYRQLENAPATRTRFPAGIRRWWGDQLALAATVGWDAFANRRSDWLTVENAVVRCFPESDYGRVIRPDIPVGLLDLGRAWLVHFKGDRKLGSDRLAARLLREAA